MFLVAPPGVENPDWKLQSTSSMRFTTYNLCETAANEIVESIRQTPTITMVAWCFKQGAQLDYFNFDAKPSDRTTPPNIDSEKQDGPARLKLR
jgi:hypothetical protein